MFYWYWDEFKNAYTGLLLLKNVKVVKLMHCSKQSLVESQLVFLYSFRPLWAVLF